MGGERPTAAGRRVAGRRAPPASRAGGCAARPPAPAPAPARPGPPPRGSGPGALPAARGPSGLRRPGRRARRGCAAPARPAAGARPGGPGGRRPGRCRPRGAAGGGCGPRPGPRGLTPAGAGNKVSRGRGGGAGASAFGYIPLGGRLPPLGFSHSGPAGTGLPEPARPSESGKRAQERSYGFSTGSLHRLSPGDVLGLALEPRVLTFPGHGRKAAKKKN